MNLEAIWKFDKQEIFVQSTDTKRYAGFLFELQKTKQSIFGG